MINYSGRQEIEYFPLGETKSFVDFKTFSSVKNLKIFLKLHQGCYVYKYDFFYEGGSYGI